MGHQGAVVRSNMYRPGRPGSIAGSISQERFDEAEPAGSVRLRRRRQRHRQHRQSRRRRQLRLLIAQKVHSVKLWQLRQHHVSRYNNDLPLVKTRPNWHWSPTSSYFLISM